MTKNKLIPRWFHLVGLHDGGVFEARYECLLNGTLFFTTPKFAACSEPVPRLVKVGDVAWAIPLMADDIFVTEADYHDALNQVADLTSEVTLPEIPSAVLLPVTKTA